MSDIIIPPIIHYCWFGKGKKPEDVKHCIDTWKAIMPEFEIIEWSEDNFKIEDANQYVKEAYRCKKWAFVSDYVRLYALDQFGGIYFDTDVEVFKSFAPLLYNHCFMGFESKDYLTTAVIGAEKGSKVIRQLKESYETRKFLRDDGMMDTETTNVVVVTETMKNRGMLLNGKQQEIDGVCVYPQSYFSSNDFRNIFNKYSKKAFAYHHFNASWYDNAGRRGFLRRIRHYLLGIARNSIGTSVIYGLKHRK